MTGKPEQTAILLVEDDYLGAETAVAAAAELGFGDLIHHVDRGEKALAYTRGRMSRVVWNFVR